jgi:acyl-CoA thioester hydrolase
MDHTATVFTMPIGLRWADFDPNAHARHSVYYDWGAMARLTFLERQGVGLAWMARNGIGPVLFREEARFQREIHFGDDLVIDLQLAAASPDGRKWRMRHRIVRGAEVAATIEVDGAWLDLRARKIVVPPADLVRACDALARAEDFAVLPGRPAAGGDPSAG